MKKCHGDMYIFIEFICICTIFVLPSIISGIHGAALVFFTRPHSGKAFLFFSFYITAAAGFEELLYRWYIPDRLSRICPYNRSYTAILCETLGILIFASVHLHLGCLNMLYAAGMGAVFRLLFIFFRRQYGGVFAVLILTGIHSLHNIGVYYVYIF